MSHLFTTSTLHFNPDPPCQPDLPLLSIQHSRHTVSIPNPKPLPALHFPPGQHQPRFLPHFLPYSKTVFPSHPGRGCSPLPLMSMGAYFPFWHSIILPCSLIGYILTLQLACQLSVSSSCFLPCPAAVGVALHVSSLINTYKM